MQQCGYDKVAAFLYTSIDSKNLTIIIANKLQCVLTDTKLSKWEITKQPNATGFPIVEKGRCTTQPNFWVKTCLVSKKCKHLPIVDQWVLECRSVTEMRTSAPIELADSAHFFNLSVTNITLEAKYDVKYWTTPVFQPNQVDRVPLEAVAQIATTQIAQHIFGNFFNPKEQTGRLGRRISLK